MPSELLRFVRLPLRQRFGVGCVPESPQSRCFWERERRKRRAANELGSRRRKTRTGKAKEQWGNFTDAQLEEKRKARRLRQTARIKDFSLPYFLLFAPPG